MGRRQHANMQTLINDLDRASLLLLRRINSLSPLAAHPPPASAAATSPQPPGAFSYLGGDNAKAIHAARLLTLSSNSLLTISSPEDTTRAGTMCGKKGNKVEAVRRINGRGVGKREEEEEEEV